MGTSLARRAPVLRLVRHSEEPERKTTRVLAVSKAITHSDRRTCCGGTREEVKGLVVFAHLDVKAGELLEVLLVHLEVETEEPFEDSFAYLEVGA